MNKLGKNKCVYEEFIIICRRKKNIKIIEYLFNNLFFDEKTKKIGLWVILTKTNVNVVKYLIQNVKCITNEHFKYDLTLPYFYIHDKDILKYLIEQVKINFFNYNFHKINYLLDLNYIYFIKNKHKYEQINKKQKNIYNKLELCHKI